MRVLTPTLAPCVYVCMCAHMCVCVCVCMREREEKKKRKRQTNKKTIVFSFLSLSLSPPPLPPPPSSPSLRAHLQRAAVSRLETLPPWLCSGCASPVAGGRGERAGPGRAGFGNQRQPGRCAAVSVLCKAGGANVCDEADPVEHTQRERERERKLQEKFQGGCALSCLIAIFSFSLPPSASPCPPTGDRLRRAAPPRAALHKAARRSGQAAKGDVGLSACDDGDLLLLLQSSSRAFLGRRRAAYTVLSFFLRKRRARVRSCLRAVPTAAS